MWSCLTWPGNTKSPFSCLWKWKKTYQALSTCAHAERVRVTATGPIVHHLVHEDHLSRLLWFAAQLTLSGLCAEKNPKTAKNSRSDEPGPQSLTSVWLCFMGGSSQLTIRVLIGYPGVFDVVVVLVAPLDALLSPEILKGTGALLCVANLVVEGRAGTISTPVGRPEHWTDSERDSFRGIFLQKPSKPQPTCYPPKDKDSVSKVFYHLPVVKQRCCYFRTSLLR